MSVDLKVGIDKRHWMREVERGRKIAEDAMKKSGGLKLKIDEKGFRQPLGRITGDLKQFDSALAASNARVIAFGASTAVIGGISKAFKELAKTTIEVGKQFSDINRILQLSRKDLEGFGNELFKIGKKNATAFQDTTKAALEFARQGLKTEETLKRTADALTLVRLTGINADKAVSSLTATVNAFDNAMVTTTSSVNKFVAVETKFAVGARDLVEAIGRVGSSAKDAKVGFDELNAMVTAVQQSTGRGGAVIGNAMKTIFTRLQRQSTLDALESFNVAVKDVQGNTLPAIQILDNFAQSYKGLTDNSQAYLREQVAGVFQANILSAILRDLGKQQSTFGQALKVSTGATNEAEQATAKLNQTLSALVTQTGLEFQRLQQNIGKATFEPIAKGILDPLKAAMQGLNDLIDGEGAGSEIANGLLKGIKNVIGGPGLVAVVGLIGKVFINTTGYLLKSLPALAGITTQTQKRATLEEIIANAMKTEANLASQILAHEGNAAVQAGIFAAHAEAAKTDLDSQEESIRNIARMLAQMPKGTYTNITAASGGTKGRRGASGFIPGMAGEANDIARGVGGVNRSAKPVAIPNFAFGGGVRGTMIANTGEHIVPNFKGGGSAIFNPNMIAQYGMPAGAKPIRGAGGYVPNFADMNRADAIRELQGMRKYGRGYAEADLARTRTIAGMFGITGKTMRPGSVAQRIERGGKKKTVAGTFLNATSKAHMLVPQAGFKSENYPYLFGGDSKLRKLASTVAGQDIDGMILSGYGPSLTASKEAQKGGRLSKVEDVLDDALVKAAESVIMAYSPSLAKIPVSRKKVEGTFLKEGGAGAMGAFKGALFEAIVSRLVGQRYEKGDANTSTLDVLLSGTAGRNAEQLFGITQTAATHADVKSSWSTGNRAKIAEQIIKNFGKTLPITMGAARGYVPNFAALGDAVEREAAAGVPLGSIRVGRSSKLTGPNNPAGLAVTNTRDEPRGLQDVVGASRGYVPNFAEGGDIGKLNLSRLKTTVDGVVMKLSRLGDDFAVADMMAREIAMDLKSGAMGTEKAKKEITALAGTLGMSKVQAKKLEAKIMAASKGPGIMGRMGGAMGGGMGGMGVGMGLTMGLPMLAGAVEQAGGPASASGALTGAGTGAAMGMIFGPWGAAVGAAGGALVGFAMNVNDVGTSLEELKKSADEYEQETTKTSSAAQEYIQALKDIQSGGTVAELEDAQKRLAKNFDQIKGTELEKSFKDAGTDVNSLTSALKAYQEATTGRLVAKRAAQQGKAFDIGFSQIGTRQVGIGEGREVERFKRKRPRSRGQRRDTFEFRDYYTDSLNEENLEKLRQEGFIGTGQKSMRFKEGYRTEVFNKETGKTMDKTRQEFMNKFGDMFRMMNVDDAFLKQMEEAASATDILGLGGSDAASMQDTARENLIKLFRERSGIFTDITDDEMNAMFSGDIIDMIRGKTMRSGGRTSNERKEIFGSISTWFSSLTEGAGEIAPDVVEAGKKAKEAAQNFTRIKNGIQRMVETLNNIANGLDNIEKVRKAFVSERMDLLGGANLGLRIGGFQQAQSDASFQTQRRQLTTTTAAKNATRIAQTIRDAGGAVGDEQLAKLKQASALFGKDIIAGLDAYSQFTSENLEGQEKINKLINSLRTEYTQQRTNLDLEQAITNSKIELEQKRRENTEKERIMNDEMRRMMSARRMGALDAELGRNRGIAELRENVLNDPRSFRGRGFRTEGARGVARSGIEQRIADMEFRNRKAAMLEENVQRASELLVQKQVIQANVDLVDSQTRLRDTMNQLIDSVDMLALGDRPTFTEADATRLGYANLKDAQMAGADMFSTPAQMAFDKEKSSIMGRKGQRSAAGRKYSTAFDFEAERQAAQQLAQELQGLTSQEEVITKLKDLKAKATGDENKILRDNIDKLQQDIEYGSQRLQNEKEIADYTRQLVSDRQVGLDQDARSFQTQFKEGMLDIYEETDYIYARLGKDLPTAFRDGMVSAMESAMDKAESFGDAMRGVAIDMLKMMRRAALEHSMSNFTNLIGMGTSSGFRKSQRGSFVPGSGTGDKVPAMLEPGEYVLNRKAVQGVGRSTLDQMNFGAFPRFAQSGGMMGIDESVHSNRMSGFFLASDNPELAEAREAERARLAEKAQKKAQKKQLLSTFLSTAVSMGVGKLMSMGADAAKGGLGKVTQTGGKFGAGTAEIKPSLLQRLKGAKNVFGDNLPAVGAGAEYGSLPAQRGGHIGRGFTNRDSVPAYMAGGEFVMNNRAVRKYGLGFMGRLNGGLIPTMQAGGPVTPAPLNSQTGANTNNISISVNTGGGGGTGQGGSQSTGNASASQQSNVDQATQGKELAERIRAAVLEVVSTEQRIGGSLSKHSRV